MKVDSCAQLTGHQSLLLKSERHLVSGCSITLKDHYYSYILHTDISPHFARLRRRARACYKFASAHWLPLLSYSKSAFTTASYVTVTGWLIITNLLENLDLRTHIDLS